MKEANQKLKKGDGTSQVKVGILPNQKVTKKSQENQEKSKNQKLKTLIVKPNTAEKSHLNLEKKAGNGQVKSQNGNERAERSTTKRKKPESTGKGMKKQPQFKGKANNGEMKKDLKNGTAQGKTMTENGAKLKKKDLKSPVESKKEKVGKSQLKKKEGKVNHPGLDKKEPIKENLKETSEKKAKPGKENQTNDDNEKKKEEEKEKEKEKEKKKKKKKKKNGEEKEEAKQENEHLNINMINPEKPESKEVSKKKKPVVALPTSNFLKMLPNPTRKSKEPEVEPLVSMEADENVSPKNRLSLQIQKKFNSLEDFEMKDDDSVGKYVAIDCEMVGVGPEGKESALARLSLVNFHGHLIYDTFVIPKEPVTDYRTKWSGVRREDLEGPNAKSLEEVQEEVAAVFKNRIVVGHGLVNDFKALMLEHPSKQIRDTSVYPPFRKLAFGRTPAMRTLAKRLLNLNIQAGEHSSIDDARTAMLLYRHSKTEWEKLIIKKAGKMKFIDHAPRKNRDANPNASNKYGRKPKSFVYKNKQKK